MKEKTPREKTEYSWRRIVDQFVRLVGHDDAAEFTSVEVDLNPKTIRDGKIAPVRAVREGAVAVRRRPDLSLNDPRHPQCYEPQCRPLLPAADSKKLAI